MITNANNNNNNTEGSTMTTTTNTHAAVEAAAEVLQAFSADLANAWRTQPFNRVDLAVGFAAGFAKEDTDDVHPTAAAVEQVAFLDREVRQMNATNNSN